MDDLAHSGRKKEAACIDDRVVRLAELGSQRLVKQEWAEHIRGDIWQIIARRHRIFYFWDEGRRRYVLLNGFLKKTRKTPEKEIKRGEELRGEYLRYSQEGRKGG